MSATRDLAAYVAAVQYEDLPPNIVAQGKLAVTDAIGNLIGGVPLGLSQTFLDLAVAVGGGISEATLVGDGRRVSAPLAAFGNAALSTMLDYSDFHRSESGRRNAWLAALGVPASLACAEASESSGADFLTGVVAGYECGARLVHSMDSTLQQEDEIYGATASLFAAVGAAGRVLKLSNEEMLSAIGMAGIYTPVSAGYKWLGDEGLTPRKDIKQGWAWQSFTGTFAAVSAKHGLRMLQENNVLDGRHGLWSMLGMDVFYEHKLGEDLGDRYYIEDFSTKALPGCAVTHAAIIGCKEIVADLAISPADIERIVVTTNRWEGVGFDDRSPERLPDREFSMPYQVAAALTAGEPGPNWYLDSTVNDPEHRRLMAAVELEFDEESEAIRRTELRRPCKVMFVLRDGGEIERQIDNNPKASSANDIRTKFVTTASQAVGEQRAQEILAAIDDIEQFDDIGDFVRLVRVALASV